MQFTIPRRWYSRLPQITVEIGAEYEDATNGVRLGAAIKLVVEQAKASVTRADLTGAVLTRADIPVVQNIDAAILARLEAGGELHMNTWHTCETTHCRAGWAIHHAGAAGADLEQKLGPSAAGALIYAVSRPGQRIPNFFASDEAALADIRRCAAEQVAA